MNSKKLHRLVRTAVFSALICAATLAVQIPAPLGGYLNFGDVFVLLAAFCLSPISAAIAGGIGSALADLILGYVQYVPATFLIKASMALAAGLLCKALAKTTEKRFFTLLVRLLGGILAEAIMVFGYLGYEALCLGYGAAALTALPLNFTQAGLGISLGLLLFTLLQKIPRLLRVISE